MSRLAADPTGDPNTFEGEPPSIDFDFEFIDKGGLAGRAEALSINGLIPVLSRSRGDSACVAPIAIAASRL
jgi:hypothetical protein